MAAVAAPPAPSTAGAGGGEPTDLRMLLSQQLSELYAAEKDAVQVLIELARASTSPRLAYLFRLHAAETREHIARLRAVLDELGMRPRPMRARGKRGLLEDCVAIASGSSAAPDVRDAALIAVAQHLEHDEIASYESVCTWAGLLGLHQAAGQLALTMAEERRAEGRLRRLSESLHATVPTS
jgi:ferritin-like metal-binding protein YciE